MELLVRLITIAGFATASGQLACQSSSSDPDTDPDAAINDGGSADATYEDMTEAVFDPTHLISVQVTMDSADFDAMRNQIKGAGSSCQPGPPTNLYTYFPASVTVDGVTVTNVGVRNKGGGSRSVAKPSIKVKFNEYVPGQRYRTMKRMTFNNTSKTDPSYVKQCLGYRLFAAAGIPAPRCNFARVSVNGEDFGIYTHVESVKKPFLARHFADDSGNLYEATGSDFRPEWVDRFELKTNKTVADRSDLDAMRVALEASDVDLLGELAPLVDVDRVLTFWALEVLIHHWDSFSGLSNNFFIYNDPSTGQFNFIPWGIDNTYADPAGRNFCKTTMLPRRLSSLPATWASFEGRIAQLLATVWDVDGQLAEVDRIVDLIGPIVDPDGTTEFAAEVALVRRFIIDRPTVFAGGPAAWTTVLLPFCWDSGCGPNPD